MTRPHRVRTVCLLALSLGAVRSVHAQQTRDDLIRQAVRSYNEFETGRAFDLLKAALDPSSGPPDSLWAHGVHLLAQIYFEQGDAGLTTAWLRWAMRLAPNTPVDRETFLPEVMAASDSARALARRGSAGDVVTETRWEWTRGTPSGQQGNMRIEAGPAVYATLRVLVGGRAVQTGQTVLLAPGSYDVQAAADGYLGTQATREVLPGITTVLRFNLRSLTVAGGAAADSVLPDATTAASQRTLAQLSVRRFGSEPACAAAFAASREGWFVTTYRALRGAESLTLDLSGGRRVTDAQVAAYDTKADVAILRVTPEPTDSLPRAATVTDGQYAWALRYPDCRGPQLSRTQITRWRDRPTGFLELRDSLSGGEQGGPLIDRTGGVLGLGSAARTAVPAERIGPLLDQARRNAGAGQLLAVGEVARRENHIYGSVAISSSVGGATARITPLEAWHWSELAWTGPLPHTFVGPMGRYQLEVTSQAQELVRRMEFTVRAATADRLAVAPEVLAKQPPQPGAAPPKKGGFPMPLAIGGGAAVVGGLAFLLLSGGGGPTPPPPPTTGGITISFPNP